MALFHSSRSKRISGTINVAFNSGTLYIGSVAFPTPMPDANYILNIYSIGNSEGIGEVLGNAWVINKTANGFGIKAWRSGSGSSGSYYSYHYDAFYN